MSAVSLAMKWTSAKNVLTSLVHFARLTFLTLHTAEANMLMHNWTQDEFLGPVRLDGLPWVTNVQRHVCRTCGETVSLPDCKHKTCLILMSFGCSGEKPKAAWKHPIKDNRPTREDVESKDYPAKRQGNEAKRRKKWRLKFINVQDAKRSNDLASGYRCLHFSNRKSTLWPIDCATSGVRTVTPSSNILIGYYPWPINRLHKSLHPGGEGFISPHQSSISNKNKNDKYSIRRRLGDQKRLRASNTKVLQK